MAAARDWSFLEVTLVAAGLLLLLWQPAVFLNDEAAQLLGFHALADGHLETRAVPAGFETFAEGYAHPSVAALERGSVVMPGSDALNVLGLPFRGLLTVLSAPLGLGAALGLIVGTGVGGATWTVARRRAPEAVARFTGAAVASALFLGALVRPGAFPAAPWLDVVSLQLATVLWVAVAAGAWHDLLRRTGAGPRLALLGAALWLLGTPLAFWALNIKYHGLALALQSLAVWAYRDGHRTPPLRTFLAAALAGLAVWNHEPSGLLLGAALLLAALPGLRDASFLPRAGAGVAGVALGLLPVGLWRLLAARALPSAPAYYPVSQGPLEGAVWNDPGGVAETFWQTFVWTDWFDVGAALSVLSWAPWLVLAAWTLARPALRERAVLWPMAVLAVVAPVLVTGDRMLFVGGGLDMRHHLAAWPWLFLLAWPALSDLLRQRPARWWAEQTAAAAVVGMAAFLVINLFWHKATGVDLVQKGFHFEGVWLHRHAGVGLAAALGLALVARPLARFRTPLLAWSLAASLTLGVWVRLVVAHPPSAQSAPFVAWPVELLVRALRWVAFSY